MVDRAGARWKGWLTGSVLFCAAVLPRGRGQETAAPPAQMPNAPQTGAVGAQQEGAVVARSARLMLLSDGVVRVGRANGDDLSAAQQNMPLAQGSVVSALENGQAEIEFEDGSVVRLTPQTSVALDYMGQNQDGDGFVMNIRVMRGLAYLELRASGAARYRVNVGGDAFWPLENSTVRVNFEDPPAVLSVLDGRVRVEHVSTPAPSAQDATQAVQGFRADVRAGESVRGDGGDGSRYFVTESVPPGTWDQWNERLDQLAADQVAGTTGVREGYAGPKGYGWSDLDASGTWYGAQGQTPVWQPDEALEAGFDPYGYGGWTNFAGAGYVWASGYGWGWTPYRCGNWQFWNGFGWGWQPNAFCGLGFRFGGYGLNLGRLPYGYVPIQVPIRRGGVHPVGPGLGPHPGRFALEREPRQVTEVGARRIGGVMMEPLRPVGSGYTARGGSAVGSSLRRDYPVDPTTHRALMGSVSRSGPVPSSPVSAGTAWRSVTTRPDGANGGAALGFMVRDGVGQDAPVRLDGRGFPYSEPVRRPVDVGGRPVPGVVTPVGPPRVQGGVGAPAYRGPVGAPAVPRYSPPPPPVMHAAPAPAVHAAPASPGVRGR